MTVKEYIEHLKTLDQDKHIWLVINSQYNGTRIYTSNPMPDEQADKKFTDIVEEVNEGDYIILGGYVD